MTAQQNMHIVATCLVGAALMAGMLTQFLPWYKVPMDEIGTLSAHLWGVGGGVWGGGFTSWYTLECHQVRCDGEGVLLTGPPLVAGGLLIAAMTLVTSFLPRGPGSTRFLAAQFLFAGGASLIGALCLHVGLALYLHMPGRIGVGLVSGYIAALLLLAAGVVLLRDAPAHAPSGALASAPGRRG